MSMRMREQWNKKTPISIRQSCCSSIHCAANYEEADVKGLCLFFSFSSAVLRSLEYDNRIGLTTQERRTTPRHLISGRLSM